jgi:serine/threonine-protein kinase
MDTDRNLLFGVLAHQVGLLDVATFAEVCTEWSARQDRALADLVVERGLVTPADRELVERVLECKLEKHGGDARASLGATAGDEIRRALSVIKDPHINQSLAGLPETDEYHTLSLGAGTHRRDRYTLSFPPAEGGMGRVFRARDGRLGRTVALKEPKPHLAWNKTYWTRFLREARITAQLEHPGIVPVYEVDQRPEDQQPYYTMRFVAGQTFREAIAAYHKKRAAGTAGPLDQQELLRAFIAVCDAVAYAHSRGVIHRDLKPDNIVLGAYGEVNVLDWGLAKLVDHAGEDELPALPVAVADQPDRTIPGQVKGTAAYMAPEQAAGRVDLIDRRTDVYGLGAILYEVLTGRAPFTGSTPNEILRQVEHQPPQRPRQFCSDSPPALEAVCLRALAKKPADRYATAQELAEEVRRWLADEPVRAWREPFATRARRWLGQHSTLATAGVAFLLTALIALAVGTTDLRKAQNRTEAATREALASAKEAQHQAERARTSEAAVRRQQQRAQQNSARLRSAVDTFWLARFVERPTGTSSDSVKNLMASILNNALSFCSIVLDEQYEDSFSDAEKARFQLSVGMIHLFSGRNAEAREALRKAITRYEKLMAAFPEVPDHRQKLAECHAFLGQVLVEDDSQLDQAVAACRTAVSLNPRDAVAQNNLGWVLIRKEQYSEALPFLQNAIELDPNRANAQSNYGWALSGLGQYDEALPFLHKAIELDPTHATAHNNLGWALNGLGRYDEAVHWLRKAIDLDPNNDHAYSNLGLALGRLGRYDEAMPVLRKAVALSPKNSMASNNLGWALIGRGHYDEAIPILGKAIEMNPGNAFSHKNLGRALCGTGRFDQAIASLQRAIQLRSDLAEAHSLLVRALLHEDRFAEALEAARRFHGLRNSDDQERSESTRLLTKVEQVVALEAKLPGILRGEAALANDTEAIRFAEVCLYKKRYERSARAWDEAFQAQPALADDLKDGHRYDAACAAALAAAGQGQDAATLDAGQRARWHRQARQWLRANLALWTRQAEIEQPGPRAEVRQWLRRWQQDVALGCVRDQPALAGLPEPERREWQQFWTEVAAVADRAEKPL